jgi:DNA-binding helix-hairpin-helix protein with protein kinase domain
LLTARAGYGFPADFSLPAVQLLFERTHTPGRNRQQGPGPDAWIAEIGRISMLHQPGSAWL